MTKLLPVAIVVAASVLAFVAVHPAGAAEARLHCVHGRADVPERRADGAVQVHDRREGGPRRRAVQGLAAGRKVTRPDPRVSTLLQEVTG